MTALKHIQARPYDATGKLVQLEGEDYYQIENIDAMPPFFMSIVSNSDHWLFISSNTGLTAGRVSAEYALFPYEAVDKIEDNFEHSGNKTIFKVKSSTGYVIWEPFGGCVNNQHQIQRNLYKHILGNKLCFEEINYELGLSFRFTWQVSDEFGFVVQSSLINQSAETIEAEVIDGLQNILPAQAPQEVQTNASNLVDAYRLNEIVDESGLGVYSLYSGITDKPQPVEVLSANCVFQLGLDHPTQLLCSRQLARFKSGMEVEAEKQIRGIRGAYLVHSRIKLHENETKQWKFIANVNQSQTQISDMLLKLQTGVDNLNLEIDETIQQGSSALKHLIAKADGHQSSANPVDDIHHYSNVLFNVMRGGIFDDQYWIKTADFKKDVQHFNKAVFEQNAEFLNSLPERITVFTLRELISQQNNLQLERIASEYLPITFGRRHGDPSRPWNKFAINIKDKAGEPLLNYQGNWRDIFQNWEALLLSYPEFTENVISKFVNASTVDGYNPYRITKEGIDWEIEDPKDPWSYIGYWGDHQIIYLLKLMELSQKFHPQKLHELLTKPIFSYANVPYRLVGFEKLLEDPKNTVVYDENEEERIQQFIQTIGADGKLVLDSQNQVYQVNLMEKLLVPLLAKLGNFVLRGGIWLNTQRPEWNDANNALVGQGLSMVTLYYMRRYTQFLEDLITTDENFDCSSEVADWFASTALTVATTAQHLQAGKELNADITHSTLKALAEAASHYRTQVYAKHGFAGKKTLSSSSVRAMLKDVKLLLDDTIQANRRSDSLYHAYNLLTVDENKLEVAYLYEMLEGQVAALSSGTLSAEQSVATLEALFASSMYRPDQKTFMLYPDEQPASFLQKNLIKSSVLQQNPLLNAVLHSPSQTVFVKDTFSGDYRFNHQISDLNALLSQLEQLKNNLGNQFNEIAKEVKSLYQETFNHHSFTGRSHGMFGFEGLGCIYWHMVSKLLLATQE